MLPYTLSAVGDKKPPTVLKHAAISTNKAAEGMARQTLRSIEGLVALHKLLILTQLAQSQHLALPLPLRHAARLGTVGSGRRGPASRVGRLVVGFYGVHEMPRGRESWRRLLTCVH